MEPGSPPSARESAERHLERGWALHRLGRNRDSLDEAKAALREVPGLAGAHGLLAFSLLELDRKEEAVQSARDCVAAAPAWAWAHYVIGRVLRRTGSCRAAGEALAECVRLDPEDADYRLETAWLRFDEGDMAAALEEAEQGLRLDPVHGPCAAVRGLALQHLDRRDEAAAAYRDALAIDPEMVIPHAGLGYLALRRSSGKEAAEAFRSALRLDPGYRWAQSGLPEALRHTFPGYGRIDRWVARLRALTHGKRGGLGCLLCLLILLFVGSSPPWFVDQDFSWTGILLWMARLLVILGTWAWAFSIWVVRPLYELALHSHPVGRWLVEPVHLRESRVLAGALLLSVLLLMAGAAFSWSRGATLGVILLLCLPPMGAVHRSGSVGWRGGERGFIVFALVLGVLGTLLPAEFGVAGIKSGLALSSLLLLHSFFISFTET